MKRHRETKKDKKRQKEARGDKERQGEIIKTTKDIKRQKKHEET